MVVTLDEEGDKVDEVEGKVYQQRGVSYRSELRIQRCEECIILGSVTCEQINSCEEKRLGSIYLQSICGAVSIDKYKRYRQKMAREGKCPHCGKPCAPYYECDERRLRKQIQYALKRLVAVGSVRRVGRGMYEKVGLDVGVNGYITKDDDRRRLPRINGRPVDLNLVVSQVGPCKTHKEFLEKAFKFIECMKKAQQKENP